MFFQRFMKVCCYAVFLGSMGMKLDALLSENLGFSHSLSVLWGFSFLVDEILFFLLWFLM
jgi:hypothetical protein